MKALHTDAIEPHPGPGRRTRRGPPAPTGGADARVRGPSTAPPVRPRLTDPWLTDPRLTDPPPPTGAIGVVA